MEEGAFGLSSGPFYAPGSFSETSELVAVARVAAEYDGVYTSHIRDESDYTIGLEGSVAEVIQVAEEAGAHRNRDPHQSAGTPRVGPSPPRFVEMVECSTWTRYQRLRGPIPL